MDLQRLAEILGITPDNIDGKMNEVHEIASDALVAAMSKWQGDTPTDQAARAVMSCMAPLLDALRFSNEINPLVFQIAIRQYVTTVTHLRALEALADLRDP